MIVWRITGHPTLDGAGGLYASARWHTKGRRIIYTAMSHSFYNTTRLHSALDYVSPNDYAKTLRQAA